MSTDTPKPKKIVITPEEVAMTPTRKITSRVPKTSTTTTVVSASVSQQPQVLELDYQNIEGSGVTFIQVNDSGEVSTIDGSMLGQDSIAIQITGDDPSTNNEEVLDGSIAIEATEEGDAGTSSSYVIQYPAPDNHRQEILEFVERVLIKESEKYADLAIFCSDGIAWSSKLILASASPFIKDVLSSVPNNDDTCLVLPHMTKVEFLTFQSALFSKDETHQTDMYSVIKGKSDSVCFLSIWCCRNSVSVEIEAIQGFYYLELFRNKQ